MSLLFVHSHNSFAFRFLQEKHARRTAFRRRLASYSSRATPHSRRVSGPAVCTCTCMQCACPTCPCGVVGWLPRCRSPASMMWAARRYKTALCANFRKGFCSYGDKCSFAHGLAELRGPVHPCTVSTRYKTTLCRRFMEEQRCLFGVACSFAHGPEELLTPDEARAMLERLGSGSPSAEEAAPTSSSSPVDDPVHPVDPVVCPEELLAPDEGRAMLVRLGSESPSAEEAVPTSSPLVDDSVHPVDPVDPVVCPPSRRQQAKQCTSGWRPWDGLMWCSVVSGVVAVCHASGNMQ